jgi:hypothetical protein
MVKKCHTHNYKKRNENKTKGEQMSNLIKIAVALAIFSVASGQLPKVLYKLRVAQLQLLKESQASNWGQAMLLPSK